MKKYLLMLVIPFLMITSCAEDTSAYLPQEKEDVVVDDVKPDEDEPEKPVQGLKPGVNLIKLDVNGVERKFKYFMPVSIDITKPISLIFELHGSYTIEEGVEPNPIEGITQSHSMCQLAIRENCIAVFPAGTNNGTSVDWSENSYMESIPFIDEIIKFFEVNNYPQIDKDRIYSTGQSSGAIFSCVLAYYRPDVFAAVAPRAGRMNISNQTDLPNRAVHMRYFLGIDDDKVDHDAAVKDVKNWANKIAGYFDEDMVKSEEPFEVDKYKKVETRKWNGAKADIEIFSIIDEGHNVNFSYMSPYVWEFFRTHPKTVTSTLFVKSSTKEIEANCGEEINLGVSFTDGASFTHTAPADWKPTYENGVLKLIAPKDYSTAENVQGSFTITATSGTKSTSSTVSYKLRMPKMFFEVGDIYYDADNKPLGVVFWVNKADKREAKIIGLDTPSAYGTIKFNSRPLPQTFETPDKIDGYKNTVELYNEDLKLSKPNSASESAYVWAYKYSVNGETGWHLPAINELQYLYNAKVAVNTILKEIGAKEIEDKVHYSSTIELKSNNKTFFNIDMKTGKISENVANDDYLGFITVRAIKNVKK